MTAARPMQVSVAKTCAHELGLKHPDEKLVERLMQAGPGTQLTPEEVVAAWQRATARPQQPALATN